MDRDLSTLLRQYKAKMGMKEISTRDIDEFLNWIIDDFKRASLEYVDFLKYLEFDFNKQECAEVSKGEYDSIVKPYTTTIITNKSKISDISSIRFVKGDMKVIDSMPVLVKGKKLSIISDDIINTFMIQNPLSKGRILGWNDLHNSGLYDVIVGVYGNIYDKDKDFKIRMLKSFKEKLLYNYKEEYSTLGNNYFYVVGSNSLKKELLK